MPHISQKQFEQPHAIPYIVARVNDRLAEEWRVPKGPRGERRPADTVGCAVMVAKIATGELEEELKEPSGKVRSGRAGAKARAETLTAAERRDIAKRAAAVRWR
jgi:hypothetical protein